MNDARRIVSLISSATEWVCYLGLQQRLVGISHECDYPESIRDLPCVTRSRISGDESSQAIEDAVRDFADSMTPIYELDQPAIASLEPDLILTQTLCNVCAVSQRDVDRCLTDFRNCGTLNLSGQTFEDVLRDGQSIVDATGNQAVSTEAMKSLWQRIKQVRQSRYDSLPRPRVTLLEWTEPLYCSGHWTPQLIQWAGGSDPIGLVGQLSRVIEPAELQAADPDILLVACCGFDRERTRQEVELLSERPWWNSLRAVAQNQLHIFDGAAYFNRPGPRLVDSLQQVAELVDQWNHPDRSDAS